MRSWWLNHIENFFYRTWITRATVRFIKKWAGWKRHYEHGVRYSPAPCGYHAPEGILYCLVRWPMGSREDRWNRTTNHPCWGNNWRIPHSYSFNNQLSKWSAAFPYSFYFISVNMLLFISRCWRWCGGDGEHLNKIWNVYFNFTFFFNLSNHHAKIMWW